jgi:hypothetical protein
MSFSYVKQQKVITDFALGFQGVNQLGLNLKSVKDALSVAHGTKIGGNQVGGNFGLGGGVGNTSPNDYSNQGHHNGPGVARSVAALQVQTPLVGAQTVSVSWIGHPVIQSISKVATGEYFVAIQGLGSFWGHAVALQTAVASVRIPPACWSSFSGYVGIFVQLYDLSGGAFVATDLPFCLTVYGPP